MKREKPNKRGESGITLIALLVMIVILIILTAVILRTLTGDEPLIGTTADTAEDYKVESYREEISHIVHSEIIAKSAIGETATTGDVADKLNEQEWVKLAYVNSEATAEVGNITVQVNEGYVYQVYYNSIYGKIEIDYIGKDIDPEDINSMTLTARYEKAVTSIFATAEDKRKGIAKLELIYKDQVVRTVEKPNGEQSWNIKEIGIGLYIVKATSKNGIQKMISIEVTEVEEEKHAPEIQSITYISKTKNSITMAVVATDKENDNLTYTIYTSTDSGSNKNWIERGKSDAKTAGMQVTLTASGLSQYTNYYIKIRVVESETLRKFIPRKII